MQTRRRSSGRPSRGPRWEVLTRLPVTDGTAGRVWAEAVSKSMTPSDVVAAIVAEHYGLPSVATVLRSTSSAPRSSAPVETEPYWGVKTFLPHAGGVAEKVRTRAEMDDVAYGAVVTSIVAEHYRSSAAPAVDVPGLDGRASQAQHRLGISA